MICWGSKTAAVCAYTLNVYLAEFLFVMVMLGCGVTWLKYRHRVKPCRHFMIMVTSLFAVLPHLLYTAVKQVLEIAGAHGLV
jgi:biotin transporter BioY